MPEAVGTKALAAGLELASEAVAAAAAAAVRLVADGRLVVGGRNVARARVFLLGLRVLLHLHHQAYSARTLPLPSYLRRQCPTRSREL